jgi:hypothetical protein
MEILLHFVAYIKMDFIARRIIVNFRHKLKVLKPEAWK